MRSIHKVNDCCLDGDVWCPSGLRSQFRVVAAQNRQIRRPLQSGIRDQFEPVAARFEDQLHKLRDRSINARANVVGLTRGAQLSEESIGAYDVAHIGEIAAGFEIADHDR